MKIIQARTPQDMAQAKALFQAYADTLDFDLTFQGFPQEVSGLPGPYAPPHGAILLAYENSQALGCVALKPLEPKICEMKRLFVRPDVRRKNLGKKLAEAIIQLAKSMGYERMRLDTMPQFTEAISLYRALGFRPIKAYCHNPFEGALYFERLLGSSKKTT